MKSILEIKNLSIGFNKTVFQNITAQLEAGTVTALMGVNGAGKSCLIKTIAHLIDPIAGEIIINKQDIWRYSALELARIVSLVLTEKFQVDYLRVDELISLGRSPHTGWNGVLKTYDKEIVAKVIGEIGLDNIRESFFSELSDGQKQKVLIARALAQGPRLLILDEPTTYLDIPSKVELIKLLRKIATENDVAVLLSTHDLELVKNHVDQIWLMGADGTFTSGSPEELTSAGLFKKHFYYAEN